MSRVVKIFSLITISLATATTPAYAELEDELPPPLTVEKYVKPSLPLASEGVETDNELPAVTSDAPPAATPEGSLLTPLPDPEIAPAPAQAPAAAARPDAAPGAPEMQSLQDPAMLEQIKRESVEKARLEVKAAPVFDKSLMFKDEDVVKLKKYYDLYLKSLVNSNQQPQVVEGTDKIDELLGKLTKKEPEPLPPGIYLNSILYRSDENSSAWINGKKYRAGEELGNLRVLKIQSNAVEVEWKTANYAVDFESWEQTFPKVGSEAGAESLLKLSQRNIKIDPDKKSIIAILKPNQHLDLMGRAIREGRPVAPVAPAVPKTGLEEPMDGLKKTLDGIKEATGLQNAGGEVYKEAQAKPIDGQDQAVEVGSTNSATFKKGSDGHFQVPATLDGLNITFKVDTGATVTIISSDEASKLGIDVNLLDYRYEGKIADGSTMKAAEVVIKQFKIGQLKFDNVTIFVAHGSFAEPLLGMSFFSKLKRFSMEGDTLTIVAPDNAGKSAAAPAVMSSVK